MIGALQKILNNTAEEGTITEVEEYVKIHNYLYRVYFTKSTTFIFRLIKGLKLQNTPTAEKKSSNNQ